MAAIPFPLSGAALRPTHNGKQPENPSSIDIMLAFSSTQQNIQVDLSADIRFKFFNIQSVWIDASGISVQLQIAFGGTNQTIIVSPGTQGTYPVVAPSRQARLFFTATCQTSTAATVKLQLLNYPSDTVTWPATQIAVASSSATTNALVAVGAANVLGIAANTARRRLIVQNVGTTVIAVLYGSGVASLTNFTFLLPAGGTSKDGSSPIINDTMWQGAVQLFSSAGGGLVTVQELT
jgi:hypothetical protein